MPRFTLAYWDIRGIASCGRMLLFYCGEHDFEDLRYKVTGPELSRESWLSVKDTLDLDFPNLPYLIDEKAGVRMTQSLAILAYIARTLRPELLEGQGHIIDMLMHQAYDFRNQMVNCFYRAKDDDDAQRYREEVFPSHLARFEAFLSKKKGGNGPFLAGSLTYVDFFFADHLDQLEVIFPGTLKPYPALSAYRTAFFALPEIVAFMESPYYMRSPCNNKSARFQ